jgi:hypothetical protein
MILSVRDDSGVLERVEGRKVGAAVADVRVVGRASRGFDPCPSWFQERHGRGSCFVYRVGQT